MFSNREFQSPYGDLGNTTRPSGEWIRVHYDEFQSPYGDLGNTTLSPSTRSLTRLTGDFFKPPAFFHFFGDPGSK